MSKRDRSAIRIKDGRVKAALLMTASDCAAKASFNSITSMSPSFQSSYFQDLRNGEDRPESHFFRFVFSGGVADIAQQRLQP